MRQHPVLGAEMIAKMPGLDKSAIVTILEHHMRFDGCGYPQRTPRRKQHLASRIVARRRRLRRDDVAAQLLGGARSRTRRWSCSSRRAGTSLDPALVRLFVSMIGAYPPRSVVRLSDGEVAIVLAHRRADRSGRTVRVIADAERRTWSTPYDVSLAERPELSDRRLPRSAGLNVDVDDFL